MILVKRLNLFLSISQSRIYYKGKGLYLFEDSKIRNARNKTIKKGIQIGRY